MQTKKVLLIGSGTMGYQIALQFAMHGIDVNLYDINEEALKTAEKNIENLLDELTESGYYTGGREEALKRIAYFTDKHEAGKDVDLVNESIVEDPEIKGKVFHDFHEICPAHTIFTTNTGYLLPSQIAPLTGRPEKFLALHFGNPVWLENLTDVMPHPGTDKEAVKEAFELVKSIRQIPLIIKKEFSGYITNHIMKAYMQASIELLIKGIASYQDIDRAWLTANGPKPPFALMDLMGLDLMYYVAKRDADAGKEESKPWAEYLYDNFISKGKHGVKNGEGFYKYPNPEWKTPGFASDVEFPD
jgi:3-hydroxybutyryl-CoA dehydrogenase